MKTPYVCENTVVRLVNGKEGRIIGVDTVLKVATIKIGRTFKTESTKNLVVVSYREVE